MKVALSINEYRTHQHALQAKHLPVIVDDTIVVLSHCGSWSLDTTCSYIKEHCTLHIGKGNIMDNIPDNHA